MRYGPPDGETDQDRQVIRTSTEYQEMRKRVLERDDDQCVCCGTRIADEGANIHHIKSFYSFPDLRLDDKNCIALCERCHAIIHGKAYTGKFQQPDPDDSEIGYAQGQDDGISRIAKILTDAIQNKHGQMPTIHFLIQVLSKDKVAQK